MSSDYAGDFIHCYYCAIEAIEAGTDALQAALKFFSPTGKNICFLDRHVAEAAARAAERDRRPRLEVVR